MNNGRHRRISRTETIVATLREHVARYESGHRENVRHADVGGDYFTRQTVARLSVLSAVVAFSSGIYTMGDTVLTSSNAASDQRLAAQGLAGESISTIARDVAPGAYRELVSSSGGEPAISNDLKTEPLATKEQATRRAVRLADTRLWSTATLNVWSEAGAKAIKTREIGQATLILATGRRENGRSEIVLDGRARWVTSEFLSPTKPAMQPMMTMKPGD